MTATNPRSIHTPFLWQAMLCFAGNFVMISTGLFLFEISLHVVLFLCLIWTAAHTWTLGYEFNAIRDMMNGGIAKALPAIYIFILIGMIIAAFMQSGTVAALIFHGLNLLSPQFFLATGLLLCSLMSLATGTSWGTAGTLGIVLMGIGDAMGIPLPLIAGMIVSGATFGDKLSPVSDTTNLAAMSAGTNLYRHITSMLWTTVPAFCAAMFIFLVFGVTFSVNELPVEVIRQLQNALLLQYDLSLFPTLLPLLVMLVLSVFRLSPEISMSTSIMTAVAVAVFYQDRSAVEVLNSLWSNQRGSTGIETLDDLLGRGGIVSMSWTLLLSLMALALGGMLYSAGFLHVLLRGIIIRIKRTATLIATTIATGIVGNMGMGEAYISIILSCQLFRNVYEEKGIENAVLSRSVEEGATMSTGLIPWTTAGAFYAATLGVPVLDYAPYAFLNYLNPVISIIMAALGIGLLHRKAKNHSDT